MLFAGLLRWHYRNIAAPISRPIVRKGESLCVMRSTAFCSFKAAEGQESLCYAISYASKVLLHKFSMQKKYLLATVFARDKLRSYLIASKVIVYTMPLENRSLGKRQTSPRPPLQEFDLEIRGKT